MIQANFWKNKLATNEVMIKAGKQKAALALLQEPYVGRARRMRSYRGVRIFQGEDDGIVKAAVAVFDPDLDIIQHPELTTNNIAVVEVQTSAWRIAFVSFYFEPDQPIEPRLD